MRSREPLTLRAPGLRTLLVLAVLTQIVCSIVVSGAISVWVGVTLWQAGIVAGGVSANVENTQRGVLEARRELTAKAEITDLKVQQALIALAKMGYLTLPEGAIGLNVPPPPGRPAVAKEN